ncbi:MAG: hypothetical protein JW751_05315 [Polyangiaceae bacterium]|nr:hypothetical protein [Polyangiaceae bacterium]
MSQVSTLEDDARDCDEGALRDATDLFTIRLTDVNVCYLAVEGARLFGSECNALASAACTGVF